jgi:uncharacterized protein YjbI with pentapeptide repeats
MIRIEAVDVDLSGACLISVIVSGAEFKRAQLVTADLRGLVGHDVNMTDANAADANLARAQLPLADLTRIDLRRADLRWAVFRVPL